MSKDEIWKDIPGFSSWYQVSNRGGVRSWRGTAGAGRLIKPRYLGKYETYTGYYISHLRKNNKTKSYSLHRLIAKTFIPNPDNKPCINHKDGDKLNNNVNNLEWVTYQENVDHAVENGLHNIGEDVGTSKLTEDQVREIKVLLETDLVAREIAEMFGVCRSTIKEINRGATWTHVKI